ncbi:LysE family translocator [Acinetobacter pollinis]|uniref:LysE family translocator n=1 Tax=Acinetobacter pollinis TaxID=2605270 RepID=UPI0018A3072F|nr:LysE family translocator [Acinetobacter pollinis]MBF7690931.1 LysE family translocator [Acinetobacter pollinis]MBF7692926.1 LysE family translocator [Acinetobacter pollinis]MBF7698529.1 LysE family translocator [Acinetobacter pollinis]MBF7700495.1 LysE family translocator [Acinetobacter pollinis]
MIELFIPFLVAIFVLTITPGLDTTLIIRTASLETQSKAMQTAMGVSFGCIVWGAIVACGLGALLATSAVAFNILKWIGAIYLSWLGIKILLNPRCAIEDNILDKKQQRNWFLKGFLTNILNPKVGIFYISFLPQFIPKGGNVEFWVMLLVLTHVIISLIWSFTLIKLMKPISKYLKQPRIVKNLDRLTGSIFILFAIKLAMTKR